MKTVSQWEVPSLLKKSEKHAVEWCIERDDNRNFYEQQIKEGYLSMSVSSKTVKRALRILEQLISQFFQAGFALTVERNRYHAPASAILFEGEVVSFRIREKQVCQPNKKDSYPSRILVPTGKLELELYAGYFEWKPSKLFADTDYTKLEDKIDEVVPYLKGAIKELQEIHLREEIERKEQEEKARKQKEHEQALEARAKQVKSILRDIRLYDRARIIRDYCDKVAPLIESESYLKKIELARRFADWIDPTVAYTDELSELYYKTDFWNSN